MDFNIIYDIRNLDSKYSVKNVISRNDNILIFLYYFHGYFIYDI